MKSWEVPVCFQVTGHVSVQAETKEAALQAAHDLWTREGQDCISMPCAEVDLANGDNPEEITEEED